MLEMADPPDLVNVGSGEEVTICELAEAVRAASGCSAAIVWDAARPDGTPRKLCDTSLIRRLGWRPSMTLDDGIQRTIACYREELKTGTIRL